MKIYILLTVGFVFLFQFGFCQKDTVLYYAGNNKPATKENAYRFVEIKQKMQGVFNVDRYIRKNWKWDKSKTREVVIVTSDTTLIINTYNKKKGNISINRLYHKVKDWYYFYDFYSNGKLKQKGITTNFYPLHLEGKLMTYYKSGNQESIRYYKNNQMLCNKNWLKNGDAYVNNIFKDVDIPPRYPGGEWAFGKDINRTVRYPKIAMQNGITGCVLVHFIVNEEGSISNIHIDATRYIDLNREAYRVIASMKKKWKPGILDGKKVKVACSVPINFQLN